MNLFRMTPQLRPATILVALALLMSHAGEAWSVDVLWTGAVSNNWAANDNWTGNGNLVPEAQYEEVAVINNGGTASVSSSVPDVAGLVLGQLAGESGTVTVVSGGTLDLVPSSGTPNGTANIGLAGAGTLDVRGGGTMTTTLLDVNQLGNVLVGQGSGAATVTSSGGMFLDGVTTVTGPGHTFASVGTVTFEGNSRFNADIRAATHTTLSVNGSTVLNGVFKPTLTGVAPTAGSRWNIIDSTAISGNFTSVDVSGLPALPSGQIYRMRQQAGGTNGTLLQFGIDQLLTLRVNWDTKAVSIVNTGPAAVTIDSYSVLSALGGLSVGTWNSLDDQNIGGANVWQEAGPTSNSLSELNPQGMLTINGGETRALGTPFNPVIPAEFGVTPEDLVFEYATPTGDKFSGLIEYTGTRDTNNFRLTIDPATGQGQIRNDSGSPIAIDGYSIQSAAGALLTSWNSLDDQLAATDWREANPTANYLSELNPSSSTSINANGGFNLGSLWNVAGTRDLAFVYQLANEATPRSGPVIYGTLPPLSTGAIAGDFDGNGSVGNNDLTLLLDNWGDAVPPIPVGWTGYQPTPGAVGNDELTALLDGWGDIAGSGGLTIAAVPEPATLLSLIFGLSTIGLLGIRRVR